MAADAFPAGPPGTWSAAEATWQTGPEQNSPRSEDRYAQQAHTIAEQARARAAAASMPSRRAPSEQLSRYIPTFRPLPSARARCPAGNPSASSWSMRTVPRLRRASLWRGH